MSSVSPVLRTCRWIALPVGYWYGTQRNEELKLIRAAERAQEMGEFYFSSGLKLKFFLMLMFSIQGCVANLHDEKKVERISIV